MKGLQVHLEMAVPAVRERGMATGQCLMNFLYSAPKDQQLHFDLGESADVESILQLARSVPINVLLCEGDGVLCQAGGGATGETAAGEELGS